jgi:magnesium transporter
MAKGSGFLLYQILDRCVDAGFPMLGQLGRKLRRLDDDIFEGRGRESVRDLSNAKQEIINFRAVIRPQRAVFRALERAKQQYFTEELDIYFDDLTDASERIWDVLENFKEIAEGLEGTNESVLSHRLNDVLRVLTAFSVILLPLTLIGTVFGMNVHFPGESSPEAFWIILGVMAVILVGMVAFFRRRGWL